jgi:hypothetical protein
MEVDMNQINSFYVRFKEKQESNKQEAWQENKRMFSLLPKNKLLLDYHDINPGKQQVEALTQAFKFYNEKLFNNTIGQAVIYFVHEAGRVLGHYKKEAWLTGKNKLDEIVIYASCLNMGDKKTHLVLVHEMCHLWESLQGNRTGRIGYHTKVFQEKMESLGLVTVYTPSYTGADTKDYLENSLFEKVYKEYQMNIVKLSTENNNSTTNLLTPEERKKEKEKERGKNAGTRIKYICKCGDKIWAKRGIEAKCTKCNNVLEVVYYLENNKNKEVFNG